MAASVSPDISDARLRSETGSPQVQTISSGDPDPFMDLLFSGWNPDLPNPPLLNHLSVFELRARVAKLITPCSIEVFFRCDPCGSRLLHRPSFLASLLLPPRDPGFPHPAILHAIVEPCLSPVLIPAI